MVLHVDLEKPMRSRPFIYDAHTQYPFVLLREEDVSEVLEVIREKGIVPEVRVARNGIVRLNFEGFDHLWLAQAFELLVCEKDGACDNRV